MTTLPLSEEARRKLEDQYKQKYQSLPEILTSLTDPRAAFLDALSGSVGNNMDNNDEDVRRRPSGV